MDNQTALSAPRPTHENSQNGTTSDDHFMREMSRDIQLLATLVATATYVAEFNPPGGVWQETGDAAANLPGDPIMRSADYRRYLVFFYCNATAFASSLMVFVLFLVLTARPEKKNLKIVLPLRISMRLGLLSFIGAYGAGTCRDTFSLVYYSLLVVAGFITHVVLQKVGDKYSGDQGGKLSGEVLMLLATFALTVTYVAGLSTPGGFWDNTEGGHRPGDAILKDHHDGRLTGFFVCNTTAFVASLLTIMVLLNSKLCLRTAFSCSIVALIGLVGAYAAGIRTETNATVYGVILAIAMVLYATVHGLVMVAIRHAMKHYCQQDSRFKSKLERLHHSMSKWSRTPWVNDDLRQIRKRQIRQASSLVQLLATLAVTITYQAGLDPPGGLWQDNGEGHKAGDPILLTTNPMRYKAFFYCNSVAFVASLVAIILVQEGLLLEHYAVEAAMTLELLGLIGAYATGSCRDASTSIYVMGIAGAAVVYVVLHVSDFALDNTGNRRGEDHVLVGRMGRRFLLFAILVANITYQAGLTPPGGFLLQDDEFQHHAGDPLLLHNYPRRYKAYFYCNSISFMLSIGQILVLVNPVLHRPAVRSHALSVCTTVSFICLMGAFAAGSTQYLKTSIYIIVLLVVVFLLVVLLLLVYLVVSPGRTNTAEATLGRVDTVETILEFPDTAEEPLERADRAEAPLERADTTVLVVLLLLIYLVVFPGRTNTANATLGRVDTVETTLEHPDTAEEPLERADRAEAPLERAGTAEAPLERAATTEAPLERAATAEAPLERAHTADEPSDGVAIQKELEVQKRTGTKRKHLMTLGILVASVTYQAGLDPPGGSWQRSSDGHDAGNPVMHDNRRHRYLAFFYSNSISFVASVSLIALLLLPAQLQQKKWSSEMINAMVVMEFFGILVAYAAGSCRQWKTSVYVGTLVIVVLAYVAIRVAIRVMLSSFRKRLRNRPRPNSSEGQP